MVGPLDLVVSASVSDSTLAFEQPFTLRATVHNQGGGEPDPTVLFYYRSTDATITSDDTQISADVVSLETSNVVAKSLSLTAAAEAGTYYYGACVQSVSGEHNPDNNCSDAVRVIVSSEFVYIPFDPSTSSHLYWTSPFDGAIYRADLDGSNVEPLVSGLVMPFDLALDVAGGQMYWVAGIGRGGIYRANLDGSNVETLVVHEGYDEYSGDDLDPQSLALDVAGGQMYWVAGEEGSIYRADLDGSNIETLVVHEEGEPSGFGLALDVAGGQMYWTSLNIWTGTFGIYRADLDGYVRNPRRPRNP